MTSTYDYIVVGGGTAGCLLASRLSENESISVLLLEAGPWDKSNVFSRIPMAFTKLYKTDADWEYYTISQKHMKNRELYWPRGKLLGGCSSINAMICMPGSPDDIDEWSSLNDDDPNWKYSRLREFFEKVQRVTDTNSGLIKGSGPIQNKMSDVTDFSKIMLETFVNAGIKQIKDFNDPLEGPLGASPVCLSVDGKGERSSATSFLNDEVKARKNLNIVTGVYVTKILFDKSGAKPRAVGILYSKKVRSDPKEETEAFCGKEVLLAGGTIGSAQLLMLSGVGPAAHLKELDIEVVKDLPVGQRLLDHLILPSYERIHAGTSMNYLTHPIKGLPSVLRWLLFKSGPMSLPVCQVAGFIKANDPNLFPPSEFGPIKDLSSGPKSADLELVCAGMSFVNHGITASGFKGDYASLGIVLLRPTSVGTIKLATSNIADKPLLDPNYLSTEHDREMAVRALKFILKLWDLYPLAKATKPLQQGEMFEPIEKLTPPMLVCQMKEMSDDKLFEYIQNNAETIYHPVGSVAMLPQEKGGCVDTKLKVYGIDGLRVVDASIMPSIIGGHTAFPVYMIAENAVLFLMNDQ